MSLGRDIFGKLDGWATSLVTPVLPFLATPVGDEAIRLDFRQQIPQSVMLGKLVRAVSGLRGALVLAESGYITECASLLRIMSDFSTEIAVIGLSIHDGGEFPAAVRDFVADYFAPLATTPGEFTARERRRYVSREALLKTHKALAEKHLVDAALLDSSHRFVNMAYDSYVHGACETTMELWNPSTGSFDMRGCPATSKRDEYVEAVFLKMHAVVVTTELTAAMTAHSDVFAQAREARRTMDASDPWKYQPREGAA